MQNLEKQVATLESAKSQGVQALTDEELEARIAALLPRFADVVEGDGPDAALHARLAKFGVKFAQNGADCGADSKKD